MAYVTQVWSYRGLIGNLAQRELKSRYKRSILGWAWSLINPAATLGIYAVVFGTIMQVVPPVAGNGHLKSFALYLFCGLIIWNFFNAVVVGSMGALLGAGPLLKKVYFPPECPAISNVLTVLIQTAIEAGILVFILLLVGNLSPAVLLFPYLLFLLAVFSLGIGLVLSLLNVYLRDINYLVGIAMNLLFYGTPIVYTFQLVQDHAPTWAETLIKLNPLTQFVGASRDIFYGMQVPSLTRMAGLTAVSALTFVVGWSIFTTKSKDVSEEL